MEKEKEKKSGFFTRIFGGNKTSSCCAVEFEDEENPETGSHPEDETFVKEFEKEENKNTGCGCGC